MVAVGLISDRFQLGELLGTGGSASVFAAVDVRDGGAVALKILHPHLSTDAGAREALFREARASAGLRHPNIVAVLDTGVHDDSLAWIALELVAGTSLAEFVEVRGPLGPDEALTVARGILLALGAAHAAGLIHRDVSPANVMIATTPGERIGVGEVRLVDFGLADATGRPALSAGVDDASAGVVGNVNYLSPEQAEGREIDARGDVYQLGAVLYFALTARAPFERTTVVETMRAHVSAPPPVPSVRRSGVPRGVDRLVVKAMLKHPDARFQSAAEMLAAVAALVPAPGDEPRTLLLGAPAAAPRGMASHASTLPDATTRLGPIGPRRAAVSRPARAPAPPAARPPVTHEPVAVAPPSPAADHRSPVWAIVGAIVVAAATVAWLLSAASATPSRPADAAVVESSPTSPATLAPAPLPVVAEQPPQVVTVAVPDVAGGTVVAAAVLLDRAGLVLGATTEEDSSAAAGTVLRSSPEIASQQDPGATVNVVVASGFNTVPVIVGLTRESAVAAVQNAGFTVAFESESHPTSPRGTALRSEPADSTRLQLGHLVTIVVASAPASTATPTPLPTGTPTPSPAD